MAKRVLVVAVGLCAAFAAWTAQYRSETRELDSAPAEAPVEDLSETLKKTQDPYARAMILREMAYQAAQKGDMAGARKHAEAALSAGGLHPLAAQQLRKELDALIASQKPKTPKEAPAERLARVNREGKATPDEQVALAAKYLQQKRVKDAVPLLEAGIARSKAPDPSWKQALLSAYLQTGNDTKALPLLRDAIVQRPQARALWLRLAAIQIQQGQHAAASATLELAARQGHLQGAPERMQWLALLDKMGAAFDAASLRQTWMEQKKLPTTATDWRQLAGTWARAREYQLAVRALETAQKQSPDTPSLVQLGSWQYLRQQYALAAEVWGKAINAGASEPSLPLRRALSLAFAGQVDEAKTAFNALLRVPKHQQLAQKWLDFLAVADAQKLLRVAPPAEAPPALAQRLAAAPLRIQGRAVVASLDATVARVQAAAAAAAPPAPSQSGDGGKAIPAGTLTPVGAELAGSGDGRIPAWDGGYTGTPAGDDPKRRLTDPFAKDQPLFTITAANVAQYRAQLSPGHLALLKAYPEFTMPVYPTRRSAAYPQAIYDATAANAGKAKLEGSDALVDARLGFPFKQPKNGVEVLWNHRTRYRGDTAVGTYTQAVVRPSGSPVLSDQAFKVFFRYNNIKDPVDLSKKNKLVYGITHIANKGGSPDFVALFHETANSIKEPRNIWVLVTKIGRMLRIPPVGYDQPFPGSDGLEFIDMVDMYNGAFDRYVWKLTGKREIYIPYNAYRLNDGSINYAKLLRPKVPDTSRARYELHRVWVIEATERGGKTHVFGKRTFYIDEDSWSIVLVENADRDGKLWRFQEGHLVQDYRVRATWAQPSYTYDLKDQRYFANKLFAEDRPMDYSQPMTEQEFLPSRVQIEYKR